MFSITINGNTPEELFKNLETILGANRAATAAPAAQFMPAPATPQPDPAAQFQAASPFPQAPAAAQAAPPATAPIATPAPAFPVASNPPMTPPAAAPSYTVDALAKAGATLAQSGKMQEALALLARYGVQTVNQLKPEQYGAFATELRALGAQI